MGACVRACVRAFCCTARRGAHRPLAAQHNVADACAAAASLGVPLLLRESDEWLAQQEAPAATEAGGGVLGAYNRDDVLWLPYDARLSSEEVRSRFVAAAAERYTWATSLAKAYRLRRFAAAFARSVGRMPPDNAARLLRSATEHALADALRAREPAPRREGASRRMLTAKVRKPRGMVRKTTADAGRGRPNGRRVLGDVFCALLCPSPRAVVCAACWAARGPRQSVSRHKGRARGAAQ